MQEAVKPRKRAAKVSPFVLFGGFVTPSKQAIKKNDPDLSAFSGDKNYF